MNATIKHEKFSQPLNITKNGTHKDINRSVDKTSIDFYNDLKRLPGFDSWGTKKEIRYLKNMLYEGEQVFAIASGIINGNTWLVACTSKRVIFVDCGMLYGVKHSEVMLDRINAVSFKNGLVLGEIQMELRPE